MAIRWCLGIATAVLFGAALCAFAQTPASPFSTACPECIRWESAIDSDQQELNRLETAVERLRTERSVSATGLNAELKSIDDLLAAARPKADAMRKRLEADKAELDKCIRRCALRGPLPPPPPEEIVIVPHADPSWCEACADYGTEARRRLLALLKAEEDYLGALAAIRELYAWLGKHAGARDSEDYAVKFGDYYKLMTRSAATGKALLQAQEDFTAAMAELAKCNADRCPKGSLSPPPSPPDFPVAACPDCDHAALVVKLLMMRVHRIKVDLVELESTISRLPASVDSTTLSSLEKEKKKLEEDLRDAEPDLEGARRYLKDCNDACERKTTTGPGTAPPPGKSGANISPAVPESSVQPAVPRAKPVCAACADKAQRLAAKESEVWDLEHAIEEIGARAQSIINTILGRKGQPATADEQATLSELDRQRRGLEPRLKSARDEAAGLKAALDACKCPPAAEGAPPPGGAPQQPPAATGKPVGPGANPNPESSSGGPRGAGGKSDTAPKDNTPKAPAPGSTGMLVPPAGGGPSMALVYAGPGYASPDAKATAVFALEPGGFVTRPKFEFHGFIGSGPSYTVTSKTVISTIVSVGPDFGRYHLYRLPDGGYNMELNAAQLQVVQGRFNTSTGGKSSQTNLNVEPNPCVQMQPILADVQGQPVVGAYILVGPPSPTPLFNPGERDGDDRPPTIMRAGSDGSYSLPTGLTGPIEISVAKGCDSYSSTATVDGTSGPRAGASPSRFAQSAGAAR